MTKADAYHFHRDCAYYDQCEIKEDRVDGHNVIRFKCPAINHADMYYKNDFETIKWECAKYVPRQQSIFDYKETADDQQREI